MTRPRLSLSAMMGLIAVLAAAIAAFRIPWLPVRASALFALVVLILLTATLGAILKRGAPWIGFALFGWSWLIVSFASLTAGAWDASAGREPIPMPITSLWLMDALAALGNVDPGHGAVSVIPNGQGGVSLVSHSLLQISHLVGSLVAACVGALLGWQLDGRGRRDVAG